jgi:hypothetical protein
VATAAAEPSAPQIRRKRVEVPALLLADALEILKGGKELLVFTNVATGSLAILYRRQDGNINLVEPDLG